jgi:hypothetical protein
MILKKITNSKKKIKKIIEVIIIITIYNSFKIFIFKWFFKIHP